MNKQKDITTGKGRVFSQMTILICALHVGFSAYAADPVIKKSAYEDGDNKIQLKVLKAGQRALVTVSGVETGQLLGTFHANKRGQLEEEISLSSGQIVPCSIKVETPGGSATRSLLDVPADCGDQGGGGGGGSSGHDDLAYNGPGMCLECHTEHAFDVFDSTHYQWKGEAPDMINQSSWLQGKYAGGVNAYCGNITGNWEGCSSCHVGRGAEPEEFPTQAQLENIDCMICHQDAYKRKRVDGIFQPDTANMSISLDEAVQTVH